MRRNNGAEKRKDIVKISGVSVYYEVKGFNTGALVSALARAGVHVFDLKRKDEKTITFALRSADSQKLFAITDGVWYNTYKVRKIRYGGYRYPFFLAVKNAGLAIGIAFFCLISWLCSDVIFGFSFTGSGSGYKREISDFLAKNNVTRFTRFSAIDLKELGGAILADNDNLSFVSLYKSGNRLVIDSAASVKPAEKLSGKAESLVADTDGEILSVKVYRGTALLNKGDKVNAGDVIVSGDVLVKDQPVKVNVIATAEIVYSETYGFSLYAENEQAAVAAAMEAAGKTPCGSEITLNKIGDKFLYEIKLYFKKIINVG